MSVWDDQYYDDEPDGFEEAGPCTAHGRMNCLECFDIDPEDIDKREFEVIVGNIETVYTGIDKDAAFANFNEHCEQSQSGRGRAGGEDVTVMYDGKPIKQYYGCN